MKNRILLALVLLGLIAATAQSVTAQCSVWTFHYNRYFTWHPVNGSDSFDFTWIYAKPTPAQSAAYNYTTRYWNNGQYVGGSTSYAPFSFSYGNWSAAWYEHNGQDYFTDGETTTMGVINNTAVAKSILFFISASTVNAQGIVTGSYSSTVTVSVAAWGSWYGSPGAGNYKNGAITATVSDK